ncbi:oocyte zinc finger protein XlCOF6-like [Ochlerotatus camptorhynchus]|uniref:oocyte zinc finger protein XlCOF6-like n=1 Tax=Ochlerotatus camptorhynchus TaxID=644619 RepID=UPI0031DF0FFF
MPCVVPTCGASVGTFKLFPQHISLSGRWLEAIQVGCEVKAADDGHLSQKEICHWHFSKPDGEVYQEPKIFFNCKTEKVEIDSCRLCLRFYPICDMVSKDGKLSGMDITLTVSESLRIDFQSNDFLELICIECLARLDLLKSIQKDFMDAEIKFNNLITIARDNAKEIREPIELPPPVEVIMPKDRDESNSESDGGIVEKDSNDEWTPPKALIDILKNQCSDVAKHKTNSTSCDGSKQPKLNLKEMIVRKCYICPVVLESANDLASHLTEKHANKGAIRCEECSRDFAILSAYNYHLSRHDPTERPYKCSFCPIRFKTKRAKMVHENTQHNMNHDIIMFDEKIKPVVCETCGESFMFQRKLRYHVRQKHASNKPTCKICGNTFTTQATLYRHMLVHTNEKPYVCSNCDASFRRLFDLKNHVQKVHEGKNPHVCAECNKEFKSYEGLYHHKRNVHLKTAKPKSQQDQLKCMLCDEIHWNTTSDLQQHISISHADESYPYFECPQCPRKFINKQSLYSHKGVHTDKFVCKECGKKSGSAQTLKIHIESVHDKRQFNCPICLTKTYKSQAALRSHMKTHTKGKQFLCDFCDKTFHRKDQLTIHRRTHTGEKPFECPNCLKRFGDDGTFSKHKKRCLALVSQKEGEASVSATLNS